MDQVADKDFFELLDNLIKEQTIDVPATNGEVYKFCTLTANQLKALLQSMVDDSLNDVSFNNTLFQIIKQNFTDSSSSDIGEKFNVIDKIVFLLTVRSNTISNKVYMVNDQENAAPIEVDLNVIVDNLKSFVNQVGYEKLHSTTIESDNIKATIGLPTIKVENQTNNEIYKNVKPTDLTDDSKVLEEFVGNAFLAEITKWIIQLEINNTALEYKSLSFDKKMKVLESLPASLVEKVVSYIEETKQRIQSCLTVSNKILPLNSSLFSVR